MQKVVFYLMSQKGLSVLKSAINQGHRDIIAFVVIGQDKNLKEDFSSIIYETCSNNGISCDYHNNNPIIPVSTYSIAISWRWLIPLGESRLIIIHDSILPKLRGFAPLVTALINKDTEIGATAIFASEDFDRGDIIKQSTRKISYPIKIEQAIDIVSTIYIDLVGYILTCLKEKKTLPSIAQNEKEATYSVWRDEEDYLIDWNSSADEIKNKIDATGFPYNGASTFAGNDLLRITDATVKPDVEIKNRDVGKVLFLDEEKPVVICGRGLLRINEIKFDNGSSYLPLKKFRIRFKNISSENN